eukprot:1636245-Alexandrium_andersonii.AAC.1
MSSPHPLLLEAPRHLDSWRGVGGPTHPSVRSSLPASDATASREHPLPGPRVAEDGGATAS